MSIPYDRRAADVGNIVKLEHVNLQIPDQQLATLFYITGLGLTRDPFMNTGLNNMWINVGQQQFHLPTGQPQRLRGRTGLVVPEREEMLKRLHALEKPLTGTDFAVAETDGCIEARSPWGDVVRCHTPDLARFGPIRLGIAYIEFDVPAGTAAGIARFYREIMKAPATVSQSNAETRALVQIGQQQLLFRETERDLPAYDGHHIQVYIADFSGPHRQLLDRGLITRESNAHEYRFQRIVDPDTGAPLYELEHEVRSLRHPIYGRQLVNRNPRQTGANYAAGADALSWSYP